MIKLSSRHSVKVIQLNETRYIYFKSHNSLKCVFNLAIFRGFDGVFTMIKYD